MTRDEAINYLKSSGMSEQQINVVISALTCNECSDCTMYELGYMCGYTDAMTESDFEE